jgi:hypothetical protein
MKTKSLLVFLLIFLLSACSAGQTAPINIPIQATEPVIPLAVQPTTEAVNSSVQVTELPATEPIQPTVTFTPKPPLEEGAWMHMPAVPVEIGDSMRAVYERGLALGNDPNRFSVIGDCQNVSSYFLAVFDKPGEFSLGEDYAYLQPTIDHYQDSFSRQSLAVRGGFNVAAILSPLRADPESCNSNESPLDCELRAWRPSIVFVSMETWWSEKPAEVYDKHMRQVIERILEAGAIPIIATKADNLEGDHSINATIAQIAYDYEIPLWNFWAAVQPLPNHGLSDDHFHLTFARNFFDDPVRMKSAWPWRNLTALQTLDVVRRGLMEQP